MSDVFENRNRLNALLLKYLKCTRCTEYCFPPIIQCENGHNHCNQCRLRIVFCSLCFTPLTDVRNRVAENLCHAMKLPCGCEAKFYEGSTAEHLKTCPFVVRCQMRNYERTDDALMDSPCSWLGSATELYDHVNETHKGLVRDSDTVTHKFPIGGTTNVLLIQCFGHQFWSRLYYNSETYTLKGMVFLFGIEEDAKRFGFEYEVFRRGCASALVVIGDVVCMRGLNVDLKECVEDGKPSAVIFEGRESFNQIHDRGFFKIKLKMVKH